MFILGRRLVFTEIKKNDQTAIVKKRVITIFLKLFNTCMCCLQRNKKQPKKAFIVKNFKVVYVKYVYYLTHILGRNVEVSLLKPLEGDPY